LNFNRDLARAVVDLADRHIHVLPAHRRNDVAEREAARRQLLAVHVHQHLALLAADQLHLRHASQRGNRSFSVLSA
jgi:hypothetical protein